MSFRFVPFVALLLILSVAGPVPAQISPVKQLAASLLRADLASIRQLLNADPSLMNKVEPGDRAAPIHMLMGLKPNSQVLDLVFGYDFDVDQKVSGQTPLAMAVSANNVEAVRRLLAAGAATSSVGPGGSSALHLAVGRATFDKNGAVAMIGLLLSGGADPNARNQDGHPPLMLVVGLAAKDDALAATLAKTLIAAGAEPDPVMNVDGHKVRLSQMLVKTAPRTRAALGKKP